MIQGTCSGAGKSLIVAGLCRIFSDLGIKVAPFKAQNMALNSFITKEGGEIGRAQALQAEAARTEASVDMNPVLLKATGEAGCQVILNGRVYKNMKARDYYAFKDKAWEAVRTAYDRLSKEYELIVVEGAGSPAEINLMEEEIVNMRIARYADAPVILVGDIDRGGVFASLYGTLELLRDCSGVFKGSKVQDCVSNKEGSDADYIRAFIINKFRGDIDILRPGLRMIEEKTGRPVIGVINYYGDLGLHEEDGIPLERLKQSEHFKEIRPLKIVVLKLRYISNFTDFDPFLYEPDVDLIYSLRKEDINTADLLILPGSKNTVSDLLFLREYGVEEWIKSAVKRGTPLIGICGGYQMLGMRICDPHGVESEIREIEGMGLLDIETTLETTKTTSQVRAEMIMEDGRWRTEGVFHLASSIFPSIKGYEIHMGRTTGDIGLFNISRTTDHASGPSDVKDGSLRGNVWGTYIHGIFDNDHLRRAILNSIRLRKGLEPLDVVCRYDKLRDEAINKWADILRREVDICFILRLIGLDSYQKLYCTRIER